MTLKSLVIALAILPMVTGTTASAPVKHLKRQRHPAHAVVLPPVSGARSEPHMIEVKPGVWISTWEYVIDEGNGRWMLETHEP